MYLRCALSYKSAIWWTISSLCHSKYYCDVALAKSAFYITSEKSLKFYIIPMVSYGKTSDKRHGRIAERNVMFTFQVPSFKE
jgi:hypothetical protein